MYTKTFVVISYFNKDTKQNSATGQNAEEITMYNVFRPIVSYQQSSLAIVQLIELKTC